MDDTSGAPASDAGAVYNAAASGVTADVAAQITQLIADVAVIKALVSGDAHTVGLTGLMADAENTIAMLEADVAAIKDVTAEFAPFVSRIKAFFARHFPFFNISSNEPGS